MTKEYYIETLESLKDRFEDIIETDELCDEAAKEAAESNHMVVAALNYAIEGIHAFDTVEVLQKTVYDVTEENKMLKERCKCFEEFVELHLTEWEEFWHNMDAREEDIVR